MKRRFTSGRPGTFRRCVRQAGRVWALLLLGGMLCVTSAVQAAPPNILFLLSDDQRPDAIAALGHPVLETPHLDALVRRGTTFTRAHSPNPICVSSRAEILTGTRGFDNGVCPPFSSQFADDVPLWPAVLRDAGYQTWYVGKWHTSGRPSTRGYTESLGLFSSGGGKYWQDHLDFKGIPVTGYRGWIFQTDDRRLFPEKGVGLTADISREFADAAIAFIERPSPKPFFLHVNFTAPHDPLIMPPGFETTYPLADIPAPPNFRPEHPFDHGNLRGRDEQMLPWPRTREAVRENLAMYYRVISHLDQQIGRILQALEDSGQAENTVVIFSSDHGLAVGSHGLMGKQNMYEHTVRVPLIMAGPGIPRNETREALVYLRDLFPTTCDLADVPVPDSVQGRSLTPVLRQADTEFREYAFGYYRDVQRMVRDDRWKLIWYPQAHREQLFHVAVDPHELHDLSASAEHEQTRARLRTALRRWQQRVGDPLADAP